MPDYSEIIIAHLESIEDRVVRVESKVDSIKGEHSAFMIEQSPINQTVKDIKKNFTVMGGAIIVLLVGSVYGKITETPAINQHKEIPAPQVKEETKDLIE